MHRCVWAAVIAICLALPGAAASTPSGSAPSAAETSVEEGVKAFWRENYTAAAEILAVRPRPLTPNSCADG